MSIFLGALLARSSNFCVMIISGVFCCTSFPSPVWFSCRILLYLGTFLYQYDWIVGFYFILIFSFVNVIQLQESTVSLSFPVTQLWESTVPFSTPSSSIRIPLHLSSFLLFYSFRMLLYLDPFLASLGFKISQCLGLFFCHPALGFHCIFILAFINWIWFSFKIPLYLDPFSCPPALQFQRFLVHFFWLSFSVRVPLHLSPCLFQSDLAVAIFPRLFLALAVCHSFVRA